MLFYSIRLFSLHLFYGYALYNLAIQATETNVIWFIHNTYISGRYRRTKISRKASDAAENLQLYGVVRFYHQRSSCTTMHISADVQRITLNVSCMTISGGRTEQLIIITGFLPHHWLYKLFSQFHSCGTYSVLSQSPSFGIVWLILLSTLIMSIYLNQDLADFESIKMLDMITRWNWLKYPKFIWKFEWNGNIIWITTLF